MDGTTFNWVFTFLALSRTNTETEYSVKFYATLVKKNSNLTSPKNKYDCNNLLLQSTILFSNHLDTRPLKANATFCGRSARRRMKYPNQSFPKGT